jgi:hypothetical protein
LILAIALGISSLIVSQMKIAREIGNSVVAFFAADTGIEKFLENPNLCTTGTYFFSYFDLDGGGTGSSGCQGTGGDPCTSTLPSHPNDACYAVKKFTGGNCPPDANYCIDSIGYYKRVRRAVQISR